MRERRRYLLILGAILALLVGAALLAVPGSPAYKKPTLGLDLRGGLEVVLKALPPQGQSVTPQNMQTAQNVMVRRVNQIGVSSPNVATQGTDEIVIQLAGIHDPAKAAAIIGSTGQLQFYDFEKDLAAPTVNQLKPTPYPTAYSLLKQIKGQVKKAGVPSAYYLFGPKTVTKTVDGKTTTTTTKHAILQTALTRKQLLGPYSGKQPSGTEILAVPGNRQLVHGPLSTQATQPVKQSPNNVYWYLFKYAPNAPGGPPEITGKELKESAIQADIGQDGQPEVQLGFKGDGGMSVQEDHQGRVRPRPAASRLQRKHGGAEPAVRAAQRDRARREASGDAVHRLHELAAPGRHRRRRGDRRHGVDEGGAGPRARPPERLAPVHVQAAHARPRSRRRSARARSTRRSSPRWRG